MKNITPLHILFTLLVLTLLVAVGFIIFIKSVTSEGMPSLIELERPDQKYATQIFSADGEILDHFFQEKRVPLTYKEIPTDFINALITTEDRNFWDHWGVYSSRVLGSIIKNITGGRREGASTITMQLAGNLYLDRRELSLTRKIREAATAFQIEQTYTKQEIIELYANTVNFGRGSYGLRIAAAQYFDKDPNKLTTAECAFLVGLLKKPEFYNRRANYDDAIKRRNLILNLMLEQNYISSKNYITSLKEEISFMKTNLTQDTYLADRRIKHIGIAPHFVETIRQNLAKDKQLADYNFYKDGLTIYTTLDSRIQKALNKAVANYMPEVQKNFNANYSWNRRQELLNKLIEKEIRQLQEYKDASKSEKQVLMSKYKKDKKFIEKIKDAASTIQLGIVVIDQTTGAVVGMVGASPKFMAENSDAKYSLNHACQIYRQPGSTFKPFVYSSALQKGKVPESRIESGPYSYTSPSGEVWSPAGSGKDSSGMMTLTQALIASVNTVSARLITQVTNPSDVIALVQKAGITSRLEGVPALSLGAGGDVSPFELTAAFGIFGNNGIYVAPYFYDKIEDKYGEIILERKPFANHTDVLEPEIAGQMTYMMKQVVNHGTATRVKNYLKEVDAAGKTGTTNDAADAWFIGYTPQLVCGIWMGFDDKRVNFDCLGSVGYGGRIAAPLWGAIMSEIYNIASLPYKQHRFGSLKTDSTDGSWRPYSYTAKQKESNGLYNYQQDTDDNENNNTEDDIHKKTFLQEGAFLYNERKKYDILQG